MGGLWRLALVLAAVGVGITGYLTAAHLLGTSIACVGGSGCDQVQASRFAYLAGVPLPYVGLAFYITVAALALAGSRRLLTPDVVLPPLLLLTLSGALFSGYLTGLQVAVIGSLCVWCLASALTETALLAVTATLLYAHAHAGRGQSNAQ